MRSAVLFTESCIVLATCFAVFSCFSTKSIRFFSAHRIVRLLLGWLSGRIMFARCVWWHLYVKKCPEFGNSVAPHDCTPSAMTTLCVPMPSQLLLYHC